MRSRRIATPSAHAARALRPQEHCGDRGERAKPCFCSKKCQEEAEAAQANRPALPRDPGSAGPSTAAAATAAEPPPPLPLPPLATSLSETACSVVVGNFVRREVNAAMEDAMERERSPDVRDALVRAAASGLPAAEHPIAAPPSEKQTKSSQRLVSARFRDLCAARASLAWQIARQVALQRVRGCQGEDAGWVVQFVKEGAWQTPSCLAQDAALTRVVRRLRWAA